MRDAHEQPLRWQPVATHLALLCVGAAYLALGIRRPLNVYDEGLILHGAERVLLGEIPYRDFWTVYAPGQYYLLAGLFRLFGTRVLVARVYDTLVRAALALVAYRLAGTLTSRAGALLVWLFEIAWLGFFEFYLYPAYPALLFCLATVLALQKATRSSQASRSLYWGIAGACIGATALFRHDFAAYQLAVTVLVAGVWYWRSTRDRRLTVVWQALWRLAAGTALVAGPLYLVLISTAGIGTMWEQLIRFPATTFPEVRAMPFPQPTAAPPSPAFWEQTLAYLPYYLPVAIGGLGVLVAIRGAFRRRSLPLAWTACSTLALLSLLLFQQARVRSDLIHNFQMLTLTPVLLAGWVGESRPGAGVRHHWRQALVVLVLGLLLAHPWREGMQRWRSGFPWPGTPASRIAKAYPVPVDRQLEQVALRLESLTSPGEPIYVGVGTHDRIFVNEPLIYFLADRPAATRYHELHPGQATTRAVQQEIIDDLEREGVRWMVISTRYDGVREPNASALSSGITDLDDHIGARFRLFAQIGPYTILSRRAQIP